MRYTPFDPAPGEGQSANWKRFVHAAVKRYGDRVKYWGFWNEPTERHFWPETPEGNCQDRLCATRHQGDQAGARGGARRQSVGADCRSRRLPPGQHRAPADAGARWPGRLRHPAGRPPLRRDRAALVQHPGQRRRPQHHPGDAERPLPPGSVADRDQRRRREGERPGATSSGAAGSARCSSDRCAIRTRAAPSTCSTATSSRVRPTPTLQDYIAARPRRCTSPARPPSPATTTSCC